MLPNRKRCGAGGLPATSLVDQDLGGDRRGEGRAPLELLGDLREQPQRHARLARVVRNEDVGLGLGLGLG